MPRGPARASLSNSLATGAPGRTLPAGGRPSRLPGSRRLRGRCPAPGHPEDPPTSGPGASGLPEGGYSWSVPAVPGVRGSVLPEWPSNPCVGVSTGPIPASFPGHALARRAARRYRSPELRAEPEEGCALRLQPQRTDQGRATGASWRGGGRTTPPGEAGRSPGATSGVSASRSSPKVRNVAREPGNAQGRSTRRTGGGGGPPASDALEEGPITLSREKNRQDLRVALALLIAGAGVFRNRVVLGRTVSSPQSRGPRRGRLHGRARRRPTGPRSSRGILTVVRRSPRRRAARRAGARGPVRSSLPRRASPALSSSARCAPPWPRVRTVPVSHRRP